MKATSGLEVWGETRRNSREVVACRQELIACLVSDASDVVTGLGLSH